jgi:hypothetical protein
MTIKEAWELVGGFSKPSKMPCHGWSISAAHCKTGSKLRLVPNSVCSKCYACRGNYRYENVRAAHDRRIWGLENPQWAEVMAFLITNLEYSGHFRWFDSGDVQSVEHLNKIVEVCKLTPNVKHWLPTREYRFVAQWLRANGAFPDNLIVRLSAYMIDGKPPVAFARGLGVYTSAVSRKNFTCPAPKQGNKCLDCRMCWDKNVANVTYKSH